MGLNNGDFDYVCALLKRHSGMHLEPVNPYLVENRLIPIAKQTGHSSVTELITRLRTEPEDGLHTRVLAALRTNETWFFRDAHPFETLRTEILPQLLVKRSASRRLDIWCAAASTGQEPYSLAMLMAESFPDLAGWNIRFLASDVSEDALERARSGCYKQLEINRGLPARMLSKYFSKQGNQWQLTDPIRHRVEFQRINLIQPWPTLPPMDLILMRNVLIYFDTETKQAILKQARRLLKPDGYLLLGNSEQILDLDTDLQQIQLGRTACYQLRSAR